jgi:GMP synthase (glutamine-hydrolysing)
MSDQKPRFLLVEARLDPKMQEHELNCLLRAGGLQREDFDILDVTRQPFDLAMLDKYEAVFIGGTGDFSVAQDRPEWFEGLAEWTRGLLERGKPTLGLCYGFHLMAHAVGGEVKTRPDLEETGTFEVTLTELGKSDPILDCLPEKFLAQQGHHDVVLSMPEGYLRLAESERCHWQAFRHPEKPFYGLQFHPELGRKEFLDRMIAYASSYAATPEVFEKIDKQVQETRNEAVISAFLQRVVEPAATEAR